MTEQNPRPAMDVDTFLLEKVDSVPQLEAMMLLWNSRPVGWTAEELASRLYISSERTEELLRDLVRHQLTKEIAGRPARYAYFERSKEQNALMANLDEAYRRDLVRISNVIHSKASSAVREFAKAFRFKKEQG